jgi:hypothetical protein
VRIVGGPEFESLEGHMLVIDCDLYGLSPSGFCGHQRFSNILRSAVFSPSKAEEDICIWDNNGFYEYIAVFAEDFLIAAKDPNSIAQEL